MINLGEAEKQKEVAGGPIPKGSLVKVKLEIRDPKNNADPNDPAVRVYSSGLKGLDLEFTVISGQFEGVRIWENWFLPPGMQDINLTKGQEGACNGSFAKMRGAIEASRNIDPDDPAGNRNINSWFDLHGLEIPIKVGIDKPRPGDKYINNSIMRVLTIQYDDFNLVMGGGEIITDTPIPELPETKKQDAPENNKWGASQSQTQAPPQSQGQPVNKWGGGQAQNQTPPQTTQTVNTPSWAQSADPEIPF